MKLSVSVGCQQSETHGDRCEHDSLRSAWWQKELLTPGEQWKDCVGSVRGRNDKQGFPMGQGGSPDPRQSVPVIESGPFLL